MEKGLGHIIYFKCSFNLFFLFSIFFPFTVEVDQIVMLTTVKKKISAYKGTWYKTCQQRPVLPTFQQAQWGGMIIGVDKLHHSKKELKYKTEITGWSSRYIFLLIYKFWIFLKISLEMILLVQLGLKDCSFPLKRVIGWETCGCNFF